MTEHPQLKYEITEFPKMKKTDQKHAAIKLLVMPTKPANLSQKGRKSKANQK